MRHSERGTKRDSDRDTIRYSERDTEGDTMRGRWMFVVCSDCKVKTC